MITPQDCRFHDSRIALPDGRQIKVSFPQDIVNDPPWENSDGHGPIRSIRHREDKRPGERILGRERWNLYAYDFAEAIAIAKRDGWGLTEEDRAKLEHELGCPPTAGQIRAAAVDADVAFLAGWINNEWTYVVVSVELMDAQGNEIASDYLGGVESCGDYASEQAAEMANALIAAHDKEMAESAYWLAREVLTR